MFFSDVSGHDIGSTSLITDKWFDNLVSFKSVSELNGRLFWIGIGWYFNKNTICFLFKSFNPEIWVQTLSFLANMNYLLANSKESINLIISNNWIFFYPVFNESLILINVLTIRILIFLLQCFDFIHQFKDRILIILKLHFQLLYRSININIVIFIIRVLHFLLQLQLILGLFPFEFYLFSLNSKLSFLFSFNLFFNLFNLLDNNFSH